MKAALHRSHGGPEVLEWADLPDPEPGPADVVVRVAAVGLNRLDLLQRTGPGLLPHFALPHVAGMDVAGEVVAVGPDVPASLRIEPGLRVVVDPSISCGTCAACRSGDDGMCRDKRVVGGSLPGGYAELCAVPATHVHPVPDHVDLVAAAAAPTVFTRAWQSLFTSGRLMIGETVLIHAAASGVTTAAVQLARRAGAQVIVTARTDAELEHGKRHGADAGINTTTTADLAAAVRDLTGGRGADLVFDHLGPALFPESIAALRPRGRLVFCGNTTGNVASLNLPAAYHKGITLIGSEAYSHTQFGRIMAEVWDADLAATIDRTLPIRDVADAHRLMADDALRGKLVLLHGPAEPLPS
ncbi:MAG TPA: zinc-binding dehydrogenase [Jatrophihabitans sp.]|nr:zinc-binding dehydrogenase [Jatrophihabitans sp.]